jgi:tRNA (guanine37-N1)-methyltransferase
MLSIDILTIFPDMFTGPFNESMIKIAQRKQLVTISVHNLRDWATDKHRLTDDRPFGGGPGMVMKPEPLFRAIENLTLKVKSQKSKVLFLTPQGQPFTHQQAVNLSQEQHLILICGRYEGIDQRVRDELVDLEISIGDYVLTGGEIPAMVVVDAISRLLPGVLSTAESLAHESHTHPLLDYPQYTQPANFEGREVPEVLLSGHHGQIRDWRKQQAEKLTKKRRPDLWKNYKRP